MCRLVATLPQLDEQKCPDMFRCTDEISYWLHENEERKEQIAVLKETISELQEELRSHRHRIKALELQVRPPYRLSAVWSTILSTALRVCFGQACALGNVVARETKESHKNIYYYYYYYHYVFWGKPSFFRKRKSRDAQAQNTNTKFFI